MTFGQKTRKLFTQSDFFICNDHKQEELKFKITRYLEMLFDTNIHTPTRAESAMYEASAAAANSACMSRQVGAAIVSRTGELISVGWNDVPRFGGGLYTEDHQHIYDEHENAMVDKDHRCFHWGGKICYNDENRSLIVDKLAKKIADAGFLKTGKTKEDVKELLRGSEIHSLIEFSRSIHAEMEAILSVAREGRHSIVGATLYTSVYPCHNCARHIVACGISQVVYIEPYLKSKAVDLHNDAVTENPQEHGKVIFRQYDGVAPASYLRIFRSKSERKLNGRLHRESPATAAPIFRVRLDSQAVNEDKVLADLSSKEQTLSPG
jgi:deoxycytidylate deaminase